MKPIYKIHADDIDITHVIEKHFVSLTLKDSEGIDSDTMTLVLSDPKKNIVFPRKGVVLRVWIGYSTEALYYKGSFTVDEPTYSWSPNAVSILARATDVKNIGAGRYTRDWLSRSVGLIVGAIAEKHGLTAAVSAEFSDQVVSMYQVNESDMNFLTRIADQLQAIAKVKNGRLLFIRRGQGVSSSGADLPTFTISESEATGSYAEHRLDEFDGVVATYYEQYVAYTYRGREVVRNRLAYYQIGHGQFIHRVSGRFYSREEAVRAAELLYESLSTASSTVSLTISHGNPALIAECIIVLSGFIDKITSVNWRVSSVTHTLGTGLKTTLNLERLTDS